jgi:putative salt-induced outer membrane protein YdiY
MKLKNQAARLVLTVLWIGTLSASVLKAEDAAPKNWKEKAEFSAVSANGNSKSTTLSFKNLFNYDWKRAALELDGGGLRSDSEGKTTAEQYYAGEKVSFKLTGKNYLFQKFRWDRNRFAGIQNRYDLSGGFGRHLLDWKNDKLFAEAGAGYINEERNAPPRNEFASGRAYAKYERTLSQTANFTQDIEYLANFKDDEDYRMNTETAVIAAISTHLSLKASFVWRRQNKPPSGFIKDDTYTSLALIVNY